MRLRSAVFSLVIFGALPAFAGAGVTYHGRLVKPDGNPVIANPVKFKIQIRTPGSENCLMYQETHALDMSTSDGIFAVTVNDGTATVVNTEPFSLDRVFQNRGTFTFAGGKCAVGNTYVPNMADGRKITVEFDDGLTGGWEPLPAQAINFVPMAMESLTVGGYGSGSMLRVNDGTGAPAAISALTQTQYNTFIDLLAGTSSLYLTTSSSLNGANLSAGSIDDTKLATGITGSKITGNIPGNAAGFTGSLNGDVTGTQSATVVGKIQGRAIDSGAPANGQVLKWNSGSSRWEASADNAGTGTVTSVTGTGAVQMTGTAADPIVGVRDASTSVKGVVQLASSADTAANLVVQSNDSRLTDARTPVAHHHNVDEVDSAVGKYLTYKPNNAQCADGQVLKWVIANQRWECANDASGLSSVVVDQVGSASGKYFTYQPNNVACANGELLKWNSAQTRWECGSASSSEATTASNVGTAGVGVFKQLSTYDLQFKKLNAASSALSLTDDAANNKIDIGVNAELAGLAGLSSNGFIKRTAAGSYSPVGAIGLGEMNTNAVMTNNSGLLVTDGTQLQNKSCNVGEILKWLSPTGWSCQADAGIVSESDPKVGANTTNFLSKWNGSALVASGLFENGGNVGIGSTSPQTTLDVNGGIKAGNAGTCDSGKAGTIQWTGSAFQGCNGSTWSTLAGNSAGGAGAAAWLIFSGNAVSSLSYSRSGTVVTVTSSSHGLATGMIVEVTSATDSGLNGAGKTITVTGANTYTFATSSTGTTSGTLTQRSVIRGQSNVASVTTTSAGKYTVAFATPMSTANYSVVPGVAKFDSNDDANMNVTIGTSSRVQTASGFPLTLSYSNSTLADSHNITAVVYDATYSGSTFASTGSGTANYVPLWTSSTALGNSPLAVSGGSVGIGTAAPNGNLHVYSAGSWPSVRVEGGSTTEGAQVSLKNGTGQMYSLTALGSASAAMPDGFGLYDNTNLAFRMIVNPSGNVGIGSTSPAAKLDVAGEVKFGNTSSTCNGTNEGQQRYNSTSHVMEYCNGTSWTAYGAAGGGIGSCPSGWTMIGDAGKIATFCIQTNEQTAANFMTASSNCNGVNDATLGRGHLCSHQEWYAACLRGTGLSNMTNNSEFTADLSDPTYAWAAGNGSCTALTGVTTSTATAYRCCIK